MSDWLILEKKVKFKQSHNLITFLSWFVGRFTCSDEGDVSSDKFIQYPYYVLAIECPG